VNLYSGGGNITVRGKSTSNWSGESDGIAALEGLTMDAGAAGNITLEGQGGVSGASYSSGVFLNFWGSGSTVGSLFKTGNGNITMTGTGTLANNNRGLIFIGSTTKGVTIESTGTGTITLNGSGATQDLQFYNANVLAASGAINIVGKAAGPLLADTGVTTLGYKAGTDVTSSTSNVTITDDSFSLTSGKGIQVNTSGTVTVESYSNSFASALTYPINDFTLSSNVSGLTIGKSTNTANITLGGATSIAGPITVYGGNINVNQNLTSTRSGSAIQLIGGSAITLAASKAITTNNGNVSLVTKGDIFGNTGASISSGTGNILLAADSDASGGGAIGLTGTSLTTSGGNITLGGGNALGTGYAEGSGTVFASATHRGIWLETASFNAGGGNISIKGKGWQGAGSAVLYSIGVDIVTGTTIQTSGAGTITIDGVGGVNTDNNSHSTGINFYAPGASNNIFSGSGAISITGTASPSLLSGRVHAGINLDYGPTQIYSTSGAITLRGVGTSSDKGINVLTGSTLYVGRKSDGSVTTSGNIRLKSNSFNWAGTGVVAGTGSLTIEPDTDGTTMGIGSGAGTLNLANSLFSGTSVFKDGFSSIILGSSSAGNLTVGGANTFVDNVSMVTGGNLTLASGATVATTQASGYIALAATGSCRALYSRNSSKP